MAVDKVALSQAVFGNAGKESSALPSTAHIISGEAVNDSVEGSVDVYIDGEVAALATNSLVKKGDEVQVSVVGGNMVVLGVVGRGDEQAAEIEQASDRYTLTLNAPTISFYPDGTVLPQDITFAAWVQKGSKGAKTSYEGTLTIEISADGETWQEFDSVQASTVAVACVDFEAALEGFAFVQVTLWTVEEVNEETGDSTEPVELATLMVSRVNEQKNYITKNAAGLWVHETEGEENYNVGSYTRMYSDGIEVGKDGNWLSRFLANVMYLGQWAGAATEAAIYMFENKAISFLKGGTRDTIRFGGDGLANAQLKGYETLISSGAAYQGITFDTVDNNYNRITGLLGDWVVEESANKNPYSGWVWRKWASGIAEAWYSPTASITSLVLWGEPLYRTNGIGARAFPFTFVGVPMLTRDITVNQANNAGDGMWIVPYGQTTTTNTGAFMAVRVGALGSTITLRVNHYARGRWK